MTMLVSTYVLTCGSLSFSSTEIADDPTFFFDAVAATEVFGVVSLLYDTLQMLTNHRAVDCHDGSDAIGQKFSLKARLAEIFLNALRLINYASLVNLPKIQVSICEKFRIKACYVLCKISTKV